MTHIVQVAVPVPLRRLFDYTSETAIAPGTRVRVSFGPRQLVGIVVSSHHRKSDRKLKPVLEILDTTPTISPSHLSLLQWAADYYHYPLGETLTAAIPALLRGMTEIKPPTGDPYYRVGDHSAEAMAGLSRAKTQRAVYEFIGSKAWTGNPELAEQFKGWRAAVKALQDKALIECRFHYVHPCPPPTHPAVTLTDEQSHAARYICQHLDAFQPILLQGITGSGKTEVYLEAARECIARGRQVLFLVPEISLTPQLVSRVGEQLGQKVYALHSAMSERARFETWWLARQGLADVVLGTRSAIFTQLKHPGLIVVDEEHDLSYKQQDGLRYHARDLAIKRALEEKIPVVLGSATPSLETLKNSHAGRYHRLELSQRAGAARLPKIHIVDLEVHPPVNGLSQPVIDAISQCLANNQQAIVYINRRGYAPLARCYQCDWQAVCERCNSWLTYHQRTGQFRCHHCGYRRRSERDCPDCGSELFFAGVGTQRVEQALLGRFPDARINRLDRDQANTAKKLYQQLEAIRQGEVDIIVGTQLITKGHDFSRVALVCVVNADQGLFSADFRAPELMFQQLLQVSGRAGRAAADGQVLIQTRHCTHPIFKMLRSHDYPSFASDCMDQRLAAAYPPFGHFVLFRAESANQGAPITLLEQIRKAGQSCLESLQIKNVELLYPAPSPMEKLANRFRAQLLVRSQHRGELHRLLRHWLADIEDMKVPGHLRWSLDVDPMDMF